VANPIRPVNTAIAKLERSSDSLRPCRSATRPQTGEAKAATKEVAPPMTPAQMSTPSTVVTPSSGRISGMMGLRKLIEAVITNWMPTIAHRVRCQPAAAGSRGSASAVGGDSSCANFVIQPVSYRNGRQWKGLRLALGAPGTRGMSRTPMQGRRGQQHTKLGLARCPASSETIRRLANVERGKRPPGLWSSDAGRWLVLRPLLHRYARGVPPPGADRLAPG